MATFTDSNGRSWDVSINVASMKRVKESTGVHLGKMLENECAILHEITSDPIKFVDVLRAICQPSKVGVSDAEFEELFDGDTAERAGEAFWEAVVNFSPSRIRPALRTLATKGEQVREAATNRMNQVLTEVDKIDPNLIFTGTASNSPESSASIPQT